MKYDELISFVICPTCKEPLKSFSRCFECGVIFAEADGTPVIVPSAISRTVKFDFQQNRSMVGSQFSACFRYPPRFGAAGRDFPYHLDLAHFDVIRQHPAGSVILEIGCGGGQMRLYLEAKGFRYIGIDISKIRVQTSLQSFGGPDFLCDSHFLPFADQTIDIVYSSAVTEHLACPYLVAQEVMRILKPNGVFLGNVSFMEPWHDDSYFHMSPLGVFELLTQAGFDISNIWPGKGYSGFRAIFTMGNKVTRFLRFLGDIVYLFYKAGNGIRNLAKKQKRRIEDDAKVAGAIDWIAQRPLK